MKNGLERRDFLKVLGVTGAGATLAGCGTRPPEHLLPYVIGDEHIVPGVATWYRTTCGECPAGCGMDIRTREGRAVKAEGNPLSPVSHGKLCARGQASLHGLYNPDRTPQALARTADGGWEAVTWDDAEQRLADALVQARGRSVLLTEGLTGTLDALLDEFCTAFGIARVRYEPFALEPVRTAYRLLFGVDALPVHDFANAEIVVNFGADFLETWISPLDHAHGFVQGHSYDRGRRGRLIAFGPHQSLTDMNADEWFAIRPGTEHLVALALARVITDDGRPAGGASTLLAGVDVEANAQAAGVPADRLREIARAFVGAGSIAVGPGIASSHGAATAVAAAVAVLNSVAGNIGRTIRLDIRERDGAATGSYADMKALVGRMRNNEIGALLVYGPNPLYALPPADAVADALNNVPFIASFASYPDETSMRAHLLLPDHHFLEAWGDGVARTGLRTLTQPVMMPVFNTKQTGDVLLSTARRAAVTLPDAATTFYDYLRARWQRDVYPAAGGGAPFETWWQETLQTGFVATTPALAAPPALDADGLGQITFAEPMFAGDAADPVLVVYPSYKYYDGRMANRPWLQELPDPVSKFCWSSWVEIHPETAGQMGIDTGHIVEVTTPTGSVAVPAWRNPATRPDVVAMALGQGHEALGTYAAGRGANPMRLLEATADAVSGGLVWQQARATITPTGDWERPIKQGLQDEQYGREIARAWDLAESRQADASRGLAVIGGAGVAQVEPAAEPQEAEHAGGHEVDVHPQDARVTELQASAGWAPVEMDASPTGYPPPGTWYGEYSQNQPRWGMVVDLDRCIGCSACITACYAENNIGIVGPELVANGRIMHWIRIERYFEVHEGESLQTRFLPMMCQQCGNAPCEPVCPVYASYHTPDGLNAQIYNRCVGTRYCANNCPYKVRTYNWFTYEFPSPLHWQLNPDVTVREKGVMEKCTFCVQRIRDAENHARMEDRGVRDGEITPACAQTCPGNAIVFGNMRDPESRVAKAAASGRAYRVLEQLNTQSAITYLRKVEGSEA